MIDALVGSVGASSEERLRSMAQSIAHRGRWRDDQFRQSSHWSIARIEHPCTTTIGIPTGSRFATDRDLTVAFCGYCTSTSFSGREDDRPFLQLIADEYRNNGLDFAKPVRGSYLILVADHESGKVHVARDGAGGRTLFYGKAGDQWLFSCEPKSITSQSAFSAKIRPAALAQYLSFSFTPGAGTMLENLYELQCGHVVTLEAGQTPKLHNFFPFEQYEWDGEQADISDQQWVDRTRDAVASAVTQRLPQSGEPVGVFLSGGLDSSIIAAEVARQHQGPVYSYALHFGPNYPNELSFAKSVADRVGTIHHEILIEPKNFVSRMRQMVWHLDEPIGDPITQPNFELARRVADDVCVVFNGEGGDPLFGGPKNIPMMMQHWYGVPREKNFREKAYLASYRRAYEEWSRVLHPNIREQIDPQRDLEAILQPYFETDSLNSFLNKLMAINIRLKGAHLIQPKVERMLAASGLVPLAPLFDEDLIELSFQMPPTMKLRQGIEKWALKRAYDDALPSEVIERPKSGMRVPVHYWFQREMRRVAKKTLSRRRLKSAELFDPARVRQLLAYDVEESSGRYGMRLWMLMTFELWREQLVERSAA